MSSDGKHYVYILKCRDESYYTGYTTNIGRRLQLHEEGKGAKYTRGRGPFSVVYEQCLPSKGDALRREMEIKNMTKQAKEAMVKEWRCQHEFTGTAKFSGESVRH